jgi:hypothetical protein
MSKAIANNAQAKIGILGAYLSCTVFVILILAYLILELSFHVWTVGQYLAGHSGVLVDVFIESMATALLGTIFSLFGKGKLRVWGVGAGILTVSGVALILCTT